MMQVYKALILIVIFMISCGSDSDGRQNQNAFTGSRNTLIGSLSTISKLAPEGQNLVSSKNFFSNFLPTPLGDDWGVNTLFVSNKPADGGQKLSTKNYIKQQLTEHSASEAAVSVFGRVSNALSALCVSGIGLRSLSDVIDTNTGYAKNGTFNFTITSDISTSASRECQINIAAKIGESIEVTISSSGGSYNSKVVVKIPQSNDYEYYISYDSNQTIKLVFLQKETKLFRVVTEFDQINQILRLEYMEGPTNNDLTQAKLLAHRVYYDEKNDESYLLSLEHDGSAPAISHRYILSGKPDANDPNFSLTIRSTEYDNLNIRKSCINAREAELLTDGTVCTNTTRSIAGLDIESANTMLDNLITSYDGSGSYGTISANTVLSFSKNNFGSSSFSSN